MANSSEKHDSPVASEPQLELPHNNGPSTSYWHSTTGTFKHPRCDEAKPLPPNAKYVIIGAGMSGAATAYHLCANGIAGTDILMLEARDAVSGSTGRNAGHVRPEAHRRFTQHAGVHGTEQAMKIVQTELKALQLMREIVQKNQVDCDFNYTTTLDVHLTEELAADGAHNFREYEKAGGSMEGIFEHDPQETMRRTGLAEAVNSYEWNAGSIHPAKFVRWLLSYVLDQGVSLATQCPVSSVIASSETTGQHHLWTVHTPRGNVSTDIVFHCTNAFAGHLLPTLDTKSLIPVRIQAHSLRADTKPADRTSPAPTMAIRTSPRSFFAFVDVPNDDKCIFGIGRFLGQSFDDGSYDSTLVDEAISSFGSLFSKFKDASQPLDRNAVLDTAWTGLIAVTPDGVPYIGPIPEMPGQFVCAGFNGHGMANILVCAPAVVKLMTGDTWESTGLPECYRYSTERLDKGKAGAH